MKKLPYFLVITLLVFVQVSFAQTTQPPPPVKNFTVEGITQYTLGNGLRVLLFPDPSKATVTVNITYLVGSRFEGYGESGMAHLLEHMVFKGSPKHTNIPQELTSHGARPNGTTWVDRTNYFETFSATDENLKWALSLESDRMVNSFIAKKDLETEFSVVRNEFEMGENDPSGVLMERVMSAAYLWHNYGKSTIGSKEDIERVPIDNLQAFYHKYYQPDNSVLTIAGKIDEAKTIQLVNDYFGVIPRPTRVLQEPYTLEPTQDGERNVELRRVGDVQVVACGYHICSGPHPDYAPLEVLSDILTNQPSGRLYKALVETKKASGEFGFPMAMHDPGFIYFSADVLKEKPLADAKTTMLGLLDNMTQQPATKEEVERAKNTLLKNFELAYNSSDRTGLMMSEYIAQGDWRLAFLYRDALDKVTVDDVNRVMKTYFKPSNRTVGTFIPDAKPDRVQVPPTPDVSSLVKEYKGKQALAAAEEFDPSPANIDARTKSGTIPGGAKYSLVSKSTRGNTVFANITLRIGSEASLRNKAILADLAADMLNKGTKQKTREQIKDEFDRLKADVSIGGSGQTVTINIQTEREYLAPVFRLVSEILHEPAFPQDEFDKLIQENLSGIEQQRSEPQAIASNMAQRLMNPWPEGDFRHVYSFEEMAQMYKAAQLGDVKKFYADFYNSAHATIGVAGAFDEAAVTAELTAMLKDWTSPVAYERAPGKFFDVAPTDNKVNTPDKANAMLFAEYNVPLRDDDPDWPALIMGNYMLGGGFLNSRLAVRLRQKEGFSYGVGSGMSANPLDQAGMFFSYAIYNPDNSEKLVAAYKEELAKVLATGFTADELKDARGGWLQGQNVNRSQDRTLAGMLSNYLFLNRTFAWSGELEKKVSALTLDQVNAAMKKWLTPEKITYVQAGDFDRKKK
ncbi:MAG TPA: pitrilysin family protein [Bacteroidota bacterium]|nr:pitrilysin family protein [Bacteroidota bacterium]